MPHHDRRKNLTPAVQHCNPPAAHWTFSSRSLHTSNLALQADEGFEFLVGHEFAHVLGSRTPPLLEQPIGTFFDSVVKKHGDRMLLHVPDQDVHWTWSEGKKEVDLLSRGLLARGYRRGDRLAVMMCNNSEWLLLQIATAKIGVVLVNLNTGYTAPELLFALNDVGCTGLVLGASVSDILGKSSSSTKSHLAVLKETIPELRRHHLSSKSVFSPSAPNLEHIFLVLNPKEWEGEEYKRDLVGLDEEESGYSSDSEDDSSESHNHSEEEDERGVSPAGLARAMGHGGVIPFHSLLSRASKKVSEKQLEDMASLVKPDDAVNIQFTSGTTGRPKGATLTHRNILNNGMLVSRNLSVSEQDVFCIPVPLFHCFGKSPAPVMI